MNIFNERYKTLNKAEVNDDIPEMISDGDIRGYFGQKANSKILKYGELEKYKSIDQLLRGSKNFIILLIEDQENSGHFVCLLKYKSKRYQKPVIEYFDSYGQPPAFHINNLPDATNDHLNQDELWLNQLLNKALRKYTIIYNKCKFQEVKTGVNTCGKHVLLRIIMNQYRDYDLVQYINFMNRMKKKYNLTYDQIASWLIPKVEE